MRTSTGPPVASLMVLLSGCGGGGVRDESNGSDNVDEIDTSAGESSESGEGDSSSSSSASTDDATTSESEGDSGIKFDMAPIPDGNDTGPGDLCKVIDEMNAVGDCRETAPPDAFEPDVQWDWWGPNGEDESLVPPLVADFPNNGHIYVLDGATGALHFQVAMNVAWSITPAIGDIDGDGLPEIIAALGPGFNGGGQIAAFEHDGTHIWTSNEIWTHSQGGSIALADLDKVYFNASVTAGFPQIGNLITGSLHSGCPPRASTRIRSPRSW